MRCLFALYMKVEIWPQHVEDIESQMCYTYIVYMTHVFCQACIAVFKLIHDLCYNTYVFFVLYVKCVNVMYITQNTCIMWLGYCVQACRKSRCVTSISVLCYIPNMAYPCTVWLPYCVQANTDSIFIDHHSLWTGGGL